MLFEMTSPEGATLEDPNDNPVELAVMLLYANVLRKHCCASIPTALEPLAVMLLYDITLYEDV